jgi:hypothetical protein
VTHAAAKTGPHAQSTRAKAMVSWAHILKALAASEAAEDRLLAKRISGFVQGTPYLQEQLKDRARNVQPARPQPRQQPAPDLKVDRAGPDASR